MKIVDGDAPAPVSNEADCSYADRIDQLVALVDRELSAREDLGRLLAPNPLSVAHSNHENHGRFVSTVLSFGAGTLLTRTLAWVYRSYRARGVAHDYFAAELEAWRRAVSALLPPAHAAEILPLYDWMLGRHETTVSEAEQPPAVRGGRVSRGRAGLPGGPPPR